jgi:DNA-binding NarL/FixJ family response regulator
VTRILIADDRESMRMALKTLFVLRPNWEICGEAEDGLEAVSKASDLRPDLIVLDFKMPLVDGLQAAQEIGRNLPNSNCDVHLVQRRTIRIGRQISWRSASGREGKRRARTSRCN